MIKNISFKKVGESKIFCSIQEITLKKPNIYGASKEIIVNSFTWSTKHGDVKKNYTYRHSEEKFERPIKKAYKITIHQSYRENGKVSKNQYYISTVDYYSAINYGLWDCIDEKRLDEVANKLSIDTGTLWDIIWTKFEPIYNRIKNEFQQSEEYQTKCKHDEIIKKYQQDKYSFSKQYECEQNDYDYCYNVFGELMNEEYLNQIKQNYKARKEYEGRSYQNRNQSNYNDYSYKGSTSISISNYSDDEKINLKRFYKLLATKFHPDNNIGVNTTKEMQLLNKLKEQWNV